MASSAAVANHLLDLAQSEGVSIDHMKLHKLVYIAHGWHLAVCGSPLIDDSIEAWQYGPVVPYLYRQFKECGHQPINTRATDYDPATGEFGVAKARFDDRTKEVMLRVWNAYKGLSAVELSTLTHQSGTPWHNIAGKLASEELKARKAPIHHQDIRAYYVAQAKERGPRPVRRSCCCHPP